MSVLESRISKLPIIHHIIPPWRPRPGFPKHSRLCASGVKPVEFPACRQRNLADKGVDDGRGSIHVAHDVALVEVADQPGGAVDDGDEQVLAESAPDRDDAAHGRLGGREVGPEVLEGKGLGLFGDQVTAIGGDPGQFRGVPSPAIEDDELVEHVAPAGLGAFDFKPLGPGLKAELLPHGTAGAEVEEFVDHPVVNVEKGAGLGPRGEGFEVAIPEEALLVVEPERLEVDQRDVEVSEACHEPSSPNINWKRSPGWSSSNRRRDAALSFEVKGMASGSYPVVDGRSDDGGGFSGAEVDVELEFIAQGGERWKLASTR